MYVCMYISQVAVIHSNFRNRNWKKCCSLNNINTRVLHNMGMYVYVRMYVQKQRF